MAETTEVLLKKILEQLEQINRRLENLTASDAMNKRYLRVTGRVETVQTR